MAQIQRNYGDYSGSETTSIAALPYIENSNKYPYGETTIYIGLGTNYLLLHDNDNALYYFKKDINSKTDVEIKSGILNNMAMAYIEKGAYKKAIQTLLPLLLQKEVINNTQIFARINSTLGHAYDKAGSTKAPLYLNTALQLREQIQDSTGLIGSYDHLSEYYRVKQTNLSNKYSLLGYKKATTLRCVDARLDCLKLLIQNSPAYKSKEFSLLYLNINDSIKKIRQNKKNQIAKINYDFSKEKDENIKLKAQKIVQQEQQQNRNTIMYFTVAIIIIINLIFR